MSAGELGPSWRDCADMVQHIVEKRIRSCEVRVAVALPKVYGKGYSSWTFLVRSEPLQGRQGAVHTARASWGNGGSFKTAPAALYWALTQVVNAALDLEGAVAEQQRF